MAAADRVLAVRGSTVAGLAAAAGARDRAAGLEALLVGDGDLGLGDGALDRVAGVTQGQRAGEHGPGEAERDVVIVVLGHDLVARVGAARLDAGGHAVEAGGEVGEGLGGERSTRVDLDIAVCTGRRNEGLSVVRSAAQFDKEIGEI